MKRFIGLLSVLLLLLTGVASGYAQNGGVLTTVKDSVRFRSGPGTNWRIITNLEPNTPIQLDARDGTNNFWVRGAISDGQVGWVASQSLNVTEAELNTLPIKTVDEPFSLAAPAANAQPQASNNDASTTTEADTTANTSAVPNVPAARSLASMNGFGYGGHVSTFDDVTINWMRYSGMTWIKKQVRYYDGMSASEAAWIINEAHARGFRVVLGVVGYPNELNNGGYVDRYASFVGELAALGADAIEVWNEPNIDREWPSGQISPANYTNLLAAAYNGIKARNPQTMVISGAPAPTGFFGGCSGGGCDDIYFLAGMRDAGAANYMDCVGVHYNEGIVPPTARSGDPRGNSGYYTRYFIPMIETYSDAFGGRVPLCFTEMGYLSPEGFGPLPGGFWWASDVSVAEQAAWIDQAMSIARNSGAVRMMIIWNIDFKNYDSDPMAGYAIIRPDLSCPACDALAR